MLKYCIIFLGNAKQPSILNQMIAEAHELRENQAFRAAVPNPVPVVVKQNHADDSVRLYYRKKKFALYYEDNLSTI